MTWSLTTLARERGAEASSIEMYGVLTITDVPISMRISNTPQSFLPRNSEDPVLSDCGASEGCWVEYTATITPSTRKGIIRFALSDVSRIPGDATFHCQSPDCRSEGDTAPDFFFKRTSGFADPPAGGQSIETSAEVNSITVRVYSRDFGGKAKLIAVTSVAGRGVTAIVQGGSEEVISLPIDQDGNGIADSWERRYQAVPYSATEDNERRPRQSHSILGDGFTAFQEYRGFVVGARNRHKFQRLDPTEMEVFFHSDGREIAEAASGILGRSGLVPGLRFHEADRRLANVNGRNVQSINRRSGPTAVYALVLLNEPLAGGELGTALRIENTNLPLVIDKNKIHRIARSVGFPEEVLLAQVVAHEAGHRMTLSHPLRGSRRNTTLSPSQAESLPFGEFVTDSKNTKLWTRLLTYPRTDQSIAIDAEQLFRPAESDRRSPVRSPVLVPEHLFKIDIRSPDGSPSLGSGFSTQSFQTQRGFIMDWTPKLDVAHSDGNAWRFHPTEEAALCVRPICP